MNYNDVISAANSYESVTNAHFTDVSIAENIVVYYVKAGNFWVGPRKLITASWKISVLLPCAFRLVSQLCMPGH